MPSVRTITFAARRGSNTDGTAGRRGCRGIQRYDVVWQPGRYTDKRGVSIQVRE